MVLLIAVLLVAAASWWMFGRQHRAAELTLYGNVDLREVELPFNDSERVAAVLVQEGDHVKKGQLLARLDTSRLQPQVDKAQAEVAAQRQAVERLHRGNRPQEIAESRANVEAAAADAANARAQYARLADLSARSAGRAVSRQDMDAAKAAVDTAAARLALARQAYALERAGPRKEDIAQGEALLGADQAELALLRAQLADADLRAPLDAVVRSRIVEPGEISSPQKSAFTLAIVNPKWVRAYIAETDLGAVHEGMHATVTVDAFANRGFKGWIGFISPVAEFTPKSVETPQLRSSLVYEIRVFVVDPHDDLRLGMPATVHLPLPAGGA
ncbi:MAG TPA: efflux RND transporter periplasmic adaptor subunit [Steroidobacteraceae bacterium]|nr:efflux RND transporter periplasmic adaptor subunit [Steroidobacteraceae bacterium]